MFGMIDQGLEAYKAELQEYKKWSDAVSAQYGPDKQHPMHWDNQEYQRSMEWNAELRGMEKALGLNKEEVERICKSVGIN